MCSCYVPSRGFNNKIEENNRPSFNNNNYSKKQSSLGKKSSLFIEEAADIYKETQGFDKNNYGNNCRSSGSNGSQNQQFNLRSNLKKAASENNQLRTEKRKVSWPDAHGKDIAQVQEFEPR